MIIAEKLAAGQSSRYLRNYLQRKWKKAVYYTAFYSLFILKFVSLKSFLSNSDWFVKTNSVQTYFFNLRIYQFINYCLIP